MKRKMEKILSTFLAAAMVLGLMGVNGLTAHAAYLSGVYEGTGEGFKSNIVTSVTVEDGLISNIEVTAQNDTAKFWNKAYPEMANRIIAAQSTDVDCVSGATYSSQGIIDSVKDALAKAEDVSVPVDKGELNELITTALEIDQDAYTSASVAAFTTALENAQSVAGNESATQEEVDGAVAALNQGIAGLVLKEEEGTIRDLLSRLIESVEAMDSTLYTRTSWSAVTRPLNNAKSVLGNGEATNDELEKAYNELKAPVDALVEYISGDKRVSTLDELKSVVPDMRSGETVYIEEDIDAVSSATLNTYEDITIDGQGHTLDGNKSNGFVYVRGGTLTIKNTVFKDAAQYKGNNLIAGAAVYARRGNAIMENCAVIGNNSRQGGVYVGNGYTLDVTNCTFVDNSATNVGGSIMAANGSTLTLANTVFAGGGASDLSVGDTATFIDNGYNVTLGEYTKWMNPDGTLIGGKNHPVMNCIPADNVYLPTTDLTGKARPVEGKGDIGCYEADAVALDSLKIAEGSLVTVSKKKTVTIDTKATPENATNQDVTWSSGNPAVATVDENGVVTPKKTGTVVITATTASGISAKTVVRVTN